MPSGTKTLTTNYTSDDSSSHDANDSTNQPDPRSHTTKSLKRIPYEQTTTT